MMKENKEKYVEFCKTTYVPIYSKPWWMDAVCGEENWNVWLYEKNEVVVAAMPYYMEKRNNYNYITKAPLTQNNGIIFQYPEGAKDLAKAKFEEEVINSACCFIEGLGVDVYEQQYQTEFTNWLPFFWNQYQEITRYTYQIGNTSDLDAIWESFAGNRRKKIKKGLKNAVYEEVRDVKLFYEEHEKIFRKQNLRCPFSYDLWLRLVKGCQEHGSCQMMVAKTEEGKIASLSFLVWDEKKLYRLLGGGIPEYQNLDTYSAMTWMEIQLAHEKGLIYDFEGSVIKRISKSNAEYGAVPKPYFRIRKVFNPEIMRMETEKRIEDQRK